MFVPFLLKYQHLSLRNSYVSICCSLFVALVFFEPLQIINTGLFRGAAVQGYLFICSGLLFFCPGLRFGFLSGGSVCSPPPPPFGVPSRDGSFGVSTWKGPVSLGWSLLTLGARTWVFGRLYLDPPLPSFSDPEGRQVPCLGVCPFSTIKGPATAPTGSTLQVAHPGRGAPSV